MKRWIILSLALVTVPTFGQSTPPAKTYQWQHPWFKKEITSPTPPTWPYRVIEEKNGVVRVDVTPPGTTAPKTVEPTPAIPSTEPMPARFRYLDPDTGKSITSSSPPAGYMWEKKRTEDDGRTWFVKITGRNANYHPAAQPDPTPSSPPPSFASVVIYPPDGLGEKLATICFEAFRKSFFDPYSARMDEFKILKMPDGSIAVVVMLNGKNRFGAYVGAKPFYCWKTAAGEMKAGQGEP